MKYFNPKVFGRLKDAVTISRTGVRHGFCDEVFLPDVYATLVASFPDPKKYSLVDKKNSGGGHKRFYVGPDYATTIYFDSVYHMRHLPKIWKDVLNEASSPEFIECLSHAIGTKFNSICNFSFGYGEEGCEQEPHLDGAIRQESDSRIKSSVAFLLYFNEDSDPISATELYDLDRKTILAKGTTMKNSWFFFEQHPNSWHGFPKVEGEHTRRIISLAYSFIDNPIYPSWSISSKIMLILRNLVYKIQSRVLKIFIKKGLQ